MIVPEDDVTGAPMAESPPETVNTVSAQVSSGQTQETAQNIPEKVPIQF